MVKPVPVPPELVEFIMTGGKFILAGHKEPDGDCIGASLALRSALKRLGKEVILCSAGPFKRTEIKPYEHLFIASPGDAERRNAQVIIMDCSSSERTGDLEARIAGLPLAFIDHHSAGVRPGAGAVVYLDPEAPSVTSMILTLIEALGLKPTQEEAEYLLFGFCTDTGFFRHIDAGNMEAFVRAGRMVGAGASPKKVFNAINGGKSFNSRILLGIQLSRVEKYFDGRLIYTCEEYEETRCFGLEGRDSDSLYQLLLSVTDVEVIIVIRQETPERCTVGLRSRDWVDVAAVAADFGGGGHKNAAGFAVSSIIADLKPRILSRFERIFTAVSQEPAASG
ncbi:MAG: bifunctional oligoribonuclease/PAP phosphatase NrnA [Treponema sp.]|jgi:phosphoesterase RecJ-like protein|nr:bifunctional oligoribonuclease/PAP phosphatase NrnA [Treponema sp.]